MACPELNAATTEVDENLTLVSKEAPLSGLGEASSPLNFSTLTTVQLGISTQSFSSSSSSNRKDKNRLAELKARRRSAIGTRGSPETNALIRYIAQQRMKAPAATPERSNASPFLPRVSSTQKQKIALFQMLVEEDDEGSDLLPGQDRETGGCKTRDFLSNGRSLDIGKENHPVHVTPPPSKRRCVSPPVECGWEIKEATSPIFKHTRCSPQKQVDQEPRGDGSPALFFFPPLRIEARPLPLRALQPAPLTQSSPSKTQQEAYFDLQSSSQPRPEDPAAGLIPSLLEMKSTGECNSSGNSEENAATKKKRVRFGGHLVPELFDRNLPPCTPLQKGGTPARAPTSAGGSQLRSLLKTPQRSESREPVPQLDFGSPSASGASPVFLLRRKRGTPYRTMEDQEVCGEIPSPSVEEHDCSFTEPAEGSWQAQPLDLSSFLESMTETVTETVTLTGATSEPQAVPSEPPQIEPLEEAESMPDTMPETEPVTEAPVPVRSTRPKRKQPEGEDEPVRRSMRSAAKSAAVKMKKKKTAWGAKEVDRSLFGSRVYASKNPTLSPVTEYLSTNCTPSPPQPRTRATVQEQQPSLTPSPLGEVLNSHPVASVVTFTARPPSCSSTNENIQETDDIITTDTLEVPSEVLFEFSRPDKQEVGRKGRRSSGPKGTSGAARRRSGRKVHGPIDVWLGVEPQCQPQDGGRSENPEAQTTTNTDSTESSPSKYTVSENGAVDTEDAFSQPPVDAPCTDANEKAEYHTSLDASTTPPLHIEVANTVSLSEQEPLSHMKSIENTAKCGRPRGRSRKSAVNQPLLDEWDKQAGQEDMEEKGPCDPASQVEINSDSHPEEATNLDLVPWQAEFNIEDVFKPVSTRGRRSVRRSLRNKVSNDDPSISAAGLAWLPSTSPTLIRKVRKSVRHHSATLPLQPPLSEKPDQ